MGETLQFTTSAMYLRDVRGNCASILCGKHTVWHKMFRIIIMLNYYLLRFFITSQAVKDQHG